MKVPLEQDICMGYPKLSSGISPSVPLPTTPGHQKSPPRFTWTLFRLVSSGRHLCCEPNALYYEGHYQSDTFSWQETPYTELQTWTETPTPFPSSCFVLRSDPRRTFGAIILDLYGKIICMIQFHPLHHGPQKREYL